MAAPQATWFLRPARAVTLPMLMIRPQRRLIIAVVKCVGDALVDGEVGFEGEGPVGVGHLVPAHPRVGAGVVDQARMSTDSTAARTSLAIDLTSLGLSGRRLR